jgi:hypothetical protein
VKNPCVSCVFFSKVFAKNFRICFTVMSEKEPKVDKYVLPTSNDFPIKTISLTKVFQDLSREKAVAFVGCCQTAMVVSAEVHLYSWGDDKRVLDTAFLHSPIINQGLRSCKGVEDIEHEQIRQLRVILHSAPSLEIEVVVFRGLHNVFFTRDQIGQEYCHRGFLWCSFSERDALSYTQDTSMCYDPKGPDRSLCPKDSKNQGTLLRIVLPTKTRLLQMRNPFFDPGSPVHVLLDTHTRFHVCDVQDKNDSLMFVELKFIS